MYYERKISTLFYKPLLFVASTFVLSFINMVYIIHELWEEMTDQRNFILCVFIEKSKRKTKKMVISILSRYFPSYWYEFERLTASNKKTQNQWQAKFMIERERESEKKKIEKNKNIRRKYRESRKKLTFNVKSEVTLSY